jgi:hypothetical protein
MRLDRFTVNSQESLMAAQALTRRKGHQEVIFLERVVVNHGRQGLTMRRVLCQELAGAV